MRGTMLAFVGLVACASPGCRPRPRPPTASDASASTTAEPGSARESPDAPIGAPETVITVDNAKLAAVGLDLLGVQNTLIASGIPIKPDAPGTFVLTAPRDVSAIAETILRTANGAPVRVKDVAQIQVRMKRP